MKLNSNDFAFARPTTQVDEKEKERINEAMGVWLSRAMDMAEENHTRDSVIYIESALSVSLFVLDLPTSAHAKQVADSLKNSGLSHLISQAKANGLAPQGVLPSQPSPDTKQATNDAAERLQERLEIVEGNLSVSERFRGELLSAAGLPLSDPTDTRAHHEATEKIRALRADAGPRQSAQANPKDSQEYKDLKAELDATKAAKTDPKDSQEYKDLKAQLDQVNQTHVPRTSVAALAKLLQPLEAGRFSRLSDEDKASEKARKDLIALGQSPATGQQPQPHRRRTA